MSLVGRMSYGHICPLVKKFTFIFIFFKNKLFKYLLIRLHNLKSDTDIAHIEPLKNNKKVSNVTLLLK